MKKTKRGRTQIALAVMVVALAAAIGLNMKYSAEQEQVSNTSSKYLGQAEYVNAEVELEDTETDYFKKLRKERKAARDEALDVLEETLNNASLSESERQTALDKANALALAGDQEAAIETVLKAKGFQKCLAIISDTSVTVIVEAKELTASQTVQIQDAVTSLSAISLNNIKIITVEG
jgi:stage III sporulation protein AH